MKKIFAIVGAALVASAVFADVSVEYTNKLSSDIVNITSTKVGDGDPDTDTSFAGITNKSSVDFKSDKVDAGITVIVFGNTEKYTKDGNEKTAWLQSWEFDDYYVEFRPINILTLGFSDTIYTPGSYLPVADDNVANGNIGSDYVVVLRPIQGLRIAGGLDNEAHLFNGNIKPDLNFGADYTSDIFSLGAAFRNVAGGSDNFGFGVYGGFYGIDGLALTLGYSYKNDVFAGDDVSEFNILSDYLGLGVSGNLLSLGVSFGKDAFSAAADFVTNFGDDENDLDLYIGANVGYQITEAFGASATFTYKTIFDNESLGFIITIEPDVTFAINDNNEIGVGVNFGIGKFGEKEEKTSQTTLTNVSFPVYWKYTL